MPRVSLPSGVSTGQGKSRQRLVGWPSGSLLVCKSHCRLPPQSPGCERHQGPSTKARMVDKSCDAIREAQARLQGSLRQQLRLSWAFPRPWQLGKTRTAASEPVLYTSLRAQDKKTCLSPGSCLKKYLIPFSTELLKIL